MFLPIFLPLRKSRCLHRIYSLGVRKRGILCPHCSRPLSGLGPRQVELLKIKTREATINKRFLHLQSPSPRPGLEDQPSFGIETLKFQPISPFPSIALFHRGHQVSNAHWPFRRWRLQFIVQVTWESYSTPLNLIVLICKTGNKKSCFISLIL